MSTRGTPTTPASGIPTALNEMSTRPARLDHRLQVPIDRVLVEGVDLCRLGESAGSTDVGRNRLDGSQRVSGEEHLRPLLGEGAGDGTSDRPSGSIDHGDLVLQQHGVSFRR